MNNETSREGTRARGLARITPLMALAASIAACGGGSSAPPSPAPAPTPVAAKATLLSTASTGPFPWQVAQAVAVALTDTRGATVPAASVTCAPHDATQVQVKADCSQITALRLGTLAIDVSGGGVTATLTVQGSVPLQWSGMHGTARQAGAIAQGNADRNAVAWGDNSDGLLGLGKDAATLPSQATPAPLSSPSPLALYVDIAQVSVGEESAALLHTDGTAQAWGDDSFNELGAPQAAGSSLAPVDVVSMTGTGQLQHVVQLELGKQNGVALIDDGSVVSWGDFSGQATTSNHRLPAPVIGPDGSTPLASVAAVSAGWNYSLALTQDGHVLSWGFEPDDGVLGGNTTINGVRAQAGYVLKADGTPLTGIVQVSAGYDFSLALAADGTVWAWGDNSYGQLGGGTIGGASGAARQVLGGSTALAGIAMVAAGGYHALALDASGHVLAWGYAPNGSLGDGPNKPVVNQTAVPRAVVDVTGAGNLGSIRSIAAGYANSYALTSDGRTLTWGSNFHGALGRSTAASTDNTPGPIVDVNAAAVLVNVPAFPNLLRRAR